MNDPGKQASKTPDRAQAQRDRILCAAQRCFIEHGFHAASMANIAEAAQMSPGLIYRYFDSKNAIVLAIIDRQLEEHRAAIAALHSDPDLGRRISELFARWQHADPAVMNAVLFLDMTAEASRDPQIAQALSAADRIARADFSAWLTQAARHKGVEPTPQDIQARAFALQCIVSGLAIRALRQPDIDPAVVAASLGLLLPHLTFRDD